MKRLFVAVHFKQSIIEAIQNICFGVKGVRWVTEDQLHLTLRFIGDCDEMLMDALGEELSKIEQTPFCIHLKGVGHFPPRGKPTVLWVGLAQSEQLISLAKSIDRAVERVGLPKERRKFHPHITVGRIKKPLEPEAIIPFLTQNSLFSIDSISIEQFHLYSSTLNPKGAIHTIEETYFLR